ncbi:MAG: hypothetical protein E7513_01485 [Ruminococcaceae bacterium]|nr:hypothetical protein [Oscillospiraceae bacterium]
MINYFYNIILKEDLCDLYSDVLTSVRKDYYLSKEKQKGKLTQNSSGDTLYYEFAIEKDKTMKWQISDDESIFSDVKSAEDGKYCVNYYDDNGFYKVLTFSKHHTLLMVEYYKTHDFTTASASPCCTIEPRKGESGLCLLQRVRGSMLPAVLYPMPYVDDEYILDKVNDEFTDYSVVASTNDGVIKFLNQGQLDAFEEFVDRAQAMKLTDNAPKSFIDDEDAVLAQKLNPKDFNVKRNLSQVVDISKAQEFSYEFEDILLGEEKQEIFEDADAMINDESTDTEVDVDATLEAFLKEASAHTVENDESTNAEESCVEDTLDDIADETVVESEMTFDKIEVDAESETKPDIDPVSSTQSTLISETEPEYEPVPETQGEIVTVEIDKSKVSENTVVVDVCDDDFVCVRCEEPDKVIENGSNKYLYFGELDENSNRLGYGRTATEDGHTAYEGFYEHNRRNGKGAYFYKDGMLCYYGDWKDNKRNGFGIGVSSFDNSVHVGKFKDNKPIGDGARIDSDGNVKFVSKTLTNGIKVVLNFDGDKIIVSKYNENGELISENSSNLTYF